MSASTPLKKRWIFGSATFVILAWIAWAFQHPIISKLGYDWDATKFGSWGDTFGALNTLFAAFAFIGVYATFRLQQIQINSQQDQIDATLKEQHRQRFESSFFQLLGLLRDLRKEVKYAVPNSQSFRMGADALNAFHDRFMTYLKSAVSGKNPPSKDDIANLFASTIRLEDENELGPYYRIIYSILRRISEDNILSDAEKAKYGNLVRSQLSTAEIGLMGLNGLTEQSNDFSKFLVEFRLLKYLPEGLLRNTLIRFYPVTAFDARD